MRKALFTLVSVFAFSLLWLAAETPNIVFIFADDLGYGDVAAYNENSKIPTPHIDKFAQEGVLFTDGHSASAVCTPSRYALVTGRYCWRTWKKKGVLNGLSTHLIDPARMTVASVLKSKGYHTACIGKWHLGMDFPRKSTHPLKGDPRQSYKSAEWVDYDGVIENGPNAQGFDYFYGLNASLDFQPYVYVENDRFEMAATDEYPGEVFPPFARAGDIADNFKHVEVLDRLTEKAVSYIGERAKAKQPFFLYFPITAPHKPVLPAERFRGKSGLGAYGDFIVQTDWAVGQIDKALRDNGVDGDTFVFISSDNGSFMHRTTDLNKRHQGVGHVKDETEQAYVPEDHTANYIYRGTKADVWEAGHRVPYIVRWPGKVRAGMRIDETVGVVDLMATCADIVDVELPEDAAEDSYSLLPLLTGKRWNRPPVIHHSSAGMFAIRDDKWKLILGNGSGGRGQPSGRPGEGPFQLYDMLNDPVESKNLIDEYPEIAERLELKMEEIITSGRSVIR